MHLKNEGNKIAVSEGKMGSLIEMASLAPCLVCGRCSMNVNALLPLIVNLCRPNDSCMVAGILNQEQPTGMGRK